MYREAHGRKVPLATVRRGELFGEMMAIDKSPRLATVFAPEETTLMMISIDVMTDKMKRAGPFIKPTIHMLMNNLRSVHDYYTPKSRSFVDAVNGLRRQCDIVTRFLKGDVPDEIRNELAENLKILGNNINNLRCVAMVHRGEDQRDDAVLNEADPPLQN